LVCALDGEGKPLLSRKIANDETEIVPNVVLRYILGALGRGH